MKNDSSNQSTTTGRANNKPVNEAQASQERIDAELAKIAAERAREREEALAQYEREQMAFEQQAAHPILLHVPLPEPVLGTPNPGVLAEGLSTESAPQGTLAAYQREGFLVELFAAHTADPENVAKLGALVRELCRMVRDSDISSRSRGLPF